MTQHFTLEEDFRLAEKVVVEGGRIALKHLGSETVKTWLKRGHEPVTEMDLKVNDYMRDALVTPRPGYGWLSEESADDYKRLGQEKIWLVDPIDGTRAFIKGNDDFTVCLALLDGGKPVVGAIYAPARDQLYLARKGGGATLNGRPIHVGDATRVAGMRLQGDDTFFDRPKRWKSPWENIIYGKHQSFALRVVEVAAGQYDAAISAKPKSEWDIAAADLIVSEAGGICCDGDGNPLTYNNENTRIGRIVASNPALKDEILEKLRGRIPKNTS